MNEKKLSTDYADFADYGGYFNFHPLRLRVSALIIFRGNIIEKYFIIHDSQFIIHNLLRLAQTPKWHTAICKILFLSTFN